MLKNLANRIIGSKLGRTRIVPITSKIVFFFIIFLLTSNFITNYINLIFNRTILINEMKELLIKDLKEMHVYCNNQREIYNFNGDLDASKKMLEKKALHEMKKKKSVTLGVTSDGVLHFQASRLPRAESFTDSDALEKIIKNRQAKSDEGYINFIFNNEKYFGVYKYNSQWDLFVIRAEELNEFYEKSRHVFYTVSVIILLITTACSLMGIFVLHHILRFVRQITGSILKMTQS
ncbi:MAG TPA: hypothetical protein DC049_10800, partial [Spirochaetia bacterium]|nr:hypothetical protein [Spirochaetia bacterium]